MDSEVAAKLRMECLTAAGSFASTPEDIIAIAALFWRFVENAAAPKEAPSESVE